MWPESGEEQKPLRTGLTTGTCATACAIAAAKVLLTNSTDASVSVTLPKGQIVELQTFVEQVTTVEQPSTKMAKASTIKDAGDDPDVTHGATIFCQVALVPGAGVELLAGEGVGTVTKPGLAIGVGEPAINPVPRQMITEHLLQLAAEHDYQGGFQVTVGIKNGEVLAQKTMNPKLGIVGGLSVLGTTGIVRPFSCAAWIASIHQGIDVAQANGIAHIAASTGNRSEQFVQTRYQMSETALIEMGDFAGAVLKHCRKLATSSDQPLVLSICGGFGKISKLADGHMDLHSKVSSINLNNLATLAQQAGATEALQAQIRTANTSIEALNLCHAQGIQLADAVCQQTLDFCIQKLGLNQQGGEYPVEVIAVNRKGEWVGQAQSSSFTEVLTT